MRMHEQISGCMKDMRIYSPVISGSGVFVLHKQLEQHIDGYHVRAFNPALGLLPMMAAVAGRPAVPITHSIPDLGPWVAHPDSRLVATFHGYYLDAERLAQASIAQRIFYKTMLRHAIAGSVARARVVTAVSTFLADLIQRDWRLGKKLVVIPNGIDTEAFRPGEKTADDGTIRILFTGNPIRNKGIHHLAALSREMPANVRISYTQGMRRGAAGPMPDSGNLVAVPGRPHGEMPGLYRENDIFFFPSLREGFGLSVAEAMACGLPVVATRGSALTELVDHGKGGFLFEPGNRQQMRDSLMRLIGDPALRMAMGNYNREKICRKYSIRDMIEGYQQVFASL